MEEDAAELVSEDGSYYTVIMGKEYRPPSPEPATSPCHQLHAITDIVEQRPASSSTELVVVRSVHHCTELNAAVIMGNITLVQQLLDKGDISISSINNALDCTGSPVLCEAVYHNRIEILKLLLNYGCNVNISNNLGLTPAHIAASNSMDKPDIILLLMKYKADINIRSYDGCSPLHIAAEKGNFKIVKTLLESDQLKPEIVMETYRHGNVYQPPPIILATANHHHVVVNIMKKATVYTDTIISNIDLVIWSLSVLSKYYYSNGVPSLHNIFGELDQALNGRHKELTAQFNNNVYDAQELQIKQSSDPLAVVYQSLLLLEHLIGPNNKLHIHYIEKVINSLIKVQNFAVIEEMLIKILQIMSRTEQEMISVNVYMMPSHLHVYVSMFMSRNFWDTIGTLTVNHHPINYIQLLKQFIHIVDTILQLKSRQSCQQLDHWGESFQNTFVQLLSLYACSIHSAYNEKSTDDRLSLNMLGFTLIDKYRKHMNEHFTSILHFTLRKAQPIVNILKRTCIGGRQAINSYILLIEMLLLMGCSNVYIINTSYKQFFCKGERPLHMAVRLAEMDPCYTPLVNLMFIHGAHYDGISLKGVVPSDIPTRSSLQVCFDLKPLPLACIVCKVIVNNNIDYWNDPRLPSGLKRYINYHDTNEY